MQYSIRPGITEATICGVRLLIPNREASEHCPNIFRMSLLSALSWSMLKNGKSIDQIARVRTEFSHKTVTEEAENLEKLFADLAERGFLIKNTKKEDTP